MGAEFEGGVAIVANMAASECNAMAAILVLTCPLLGSGLRPFIFLSNNKEVVATSFILGAI